MRGSSGTGKALHDLRVQLRKEARLRGDMDTVRRLDTAIAAHATARRLYERQGAK